MTEGEAVEQENQSAHGRDGDSDLDGTDRTSVATVPRGTAVVRARWAEWVFGLALVLYTVLAILAHRYAYFDWDVRLALRIQSISTPGFRTFMVSLSTIGSGWLPFVLVVGASTALIFKGFRLEGLLCLLSSGLGALMNNILKLIIARPRPPNTLVNVMRHYSHDSFPSGHVTFYVEFFGFLLFLSYVLLKRGWLRRAAIGLFATLICLIGVSRVYMGAHWPSDVAGAYLAGGIWLMVMIEVYRQRKAAQQKDAPSNEEQ